MYYTNLHIEIIFLYTISYLTILYRRFKILLYDFIYIIYNYLTYISYKVISFQRRELNDKMPNQCKRA